MTEYVMPEKTRAKPDERLALMGLDTLLQSIDKYADPLKERMKQDRFALRGLRSAKTSLARAIKAVSGTIETENLAYIQQNGHRFEIVIRERQALKDPLWMYSKLDDLKMVLKYAMRAECEMCLREAGEVKRCELRKAMIQMVDEPEVDFGCGFRSGIIKPKDSKKEREDGLHV